jgi:hypothetical protein
MAQKPNEDRYKSIFVLEAKHGRRNRLFCWTVPTIVIPLDSSSTTRSVSKEIICGHISI